MAQGCLGNVFIVLLVLTIASNMVMCVIQSLEMLQASVEDWRMCFCTWLAGSAAVQQNIPAGTFPSHLKPKGSMTGQALKLSQVMYCKLLHQLLILSFSFLTAWIPLRDVAFSCPKLLSHHHMNTSRKVHLCSSPLGCWLTQPEKQRWSLPRRRVHLS